MKKKDYLSRDPRRTILHWKNSGMYPEMIFILADIHLCWQEIRKQREEVDQATGTGYKVDRKRVDHQTIVGGYLQGLEKRKIYPSLWDMKKLRETAQWVLDHPPTVIEHEVGVLEGRKLMRYAVEYPVAIPELKVHGLETIDNGRTTYRVWQKAEI